MLHVYADECPCKLLLMIKVDCISIYYNHYRNTLVGFLCIGECPCSATTSNHGIQKIVFYMFSPPRHCSITATAPYHYHTTSTSSHYFILSFHHINYHMCLYYYFTPILMFLFKSCYPYFPRFYHF